MHFNDQTGFDRAGNFHSEDLHVIEHFTPDGPDHIRYRVTIEDPKVFTRPWDMETVDSTAARRRRRAFSSTIARASRTRSCIRTILPQPGRET